MKSCQIKDPGPPGAAQSDNANAAPDEATMTPLVLPRCRLFVAKSPPCSWLHSATLLQFNELPWGGEGDAGEGCC